MVCGVLVMIERLCTKYEFTFEANNIQAKPKMYNTQIYNSNAIFQRYNNKIWGIMTVVYTAGQRNCSPAKQNNKCITYNPSYI